MKRVLSCMMAAVFCLVLFAANPSAYAGATKAELKIGMAQEFENLNNMIGQMSATSYVYNMVCRTLVVINADGKYVPQLATTIPTLENGMAKIYTEGGQKKIEAVWEIKSNAVWGDGTPVTGHDVVFSWEVARSNNVSVGEKEIYDQVGKIVVDPANPKKFTFYHDEAKWDYYQIPSFYILPKHLEKPVFDKYGNQKEGYDKNSLYSTNPTNPGLYNGPYRVKEIKLGSHVALVRNDLFYGKRPYFDSIVTKLIPNPTA